MNPIIHLESIRKSYFMGKNELEVLKGISLDIRKNEYVALMGPSGSGKSTLMNIIGCLDTPSGGKYILNDKDVSNMTDNELAEVRNKEIGFVFQTFNLLPRSSALENVELPLLYSRSGISGREQHERAMAALEMVGLGQRTEPSVRTYSGGERQRVTVARALARSPAVLLADEPTASLDRASADRLIDDLLEVVAAEGCTLIAVTHDAHLRRRLGGELRLADGRVVEPALG